jgi:DNA gyrase subunit B
MDDYLLELGMSDVQVKLRNKQEPVSIEEFKQFVKTILELENFILRVERKGIPFREFLSLRNPLGHFPRFQIHLLDEIQFAYSEEEFVKLRQTDEERQKHRHEETLASIPTFEVTEEMRLFKPNRLHFTELYEEGAVEQIEAELKAYGLQLSDYFASDGTMVEVMEEGGKFHTFHTLKDFIDFLRENGRKGIEIQRYKGLGEMNADQLWETTMDPAKRTLINVTLHDTVAADRMFTMLMGEDVPPRRDFIKQYALSVKNLDI